MLETDLLVIGGGINGVGVAADAACRGLKIILCEKGDLASATSSASTKLIHGGLRYLEQAQFHLVRESLRERAILLRRAPHLVHPLKFIFPCVENTRPTWQTYLGFKLYDWLTSNDGLEKSKYFTLNSEQNPLKKSYHQAFSYSDAQTDDARLVILNALLAEARGAKILTHTECIKAQVEAGIWIVTLRSNQVEQKVKAKAIVNAAGSCTKQVLEKVFMLASQTEICLVKGSHIVIPKLYEGNQAYTLQSQDGRIIFTIPYENDYMLIGTTDVPSNTADLKPEISPEEIVYLIKIIQHYFSKNINPDEVIWSYSGLRCLVRDGQKHLSLISREHKLEIDSSKGAPLISLFGGKLTSYRAFATKTVDSLRIYFAKLKTNSTENIILPGGDLGTSFNNFTKEMQARYSWLAPEIVQRYAKSYGTLSRLILKNSHSIKELGFDFGAGLYQAEIDYLLKHEWARSSEDILWRRSKLGLKSKSIDLKKLEDYLKEKKSETT